MECKCCGLTLVSAPHLARSYHHLFPLPAFKEVCLSFYQTVPMFFLFSAVPATGILKKNLFLFPIVTRALWTWVLVPLRLKLESCVVKSPISLTMSLQGLGVSLPKFLLGYAENHFHVESAGTPFCSSSSNPSGLKPASLAFAGWRRTEETLACTNVRTARRSSAPTATCSSTSHFIRVRVRKIRRTWWQNLIGATRNVLTRKFLP